MNTYTIRTFAAARELVGDRIELTLEKNSTVGMLKSRLLDVYPTLRELKEFAVARNEEYALDADPVRPGDELVIIPPVSGG